MKYNKNNIKINGNYSLTSPLSDHNVSQTMMFAHRAHTANANWILWTPQQL